MSFLIGKYNNTKLLHLYQNSTNIEPNPIPGTIFHSSLPFKRISNIVRFNPYGSYTYIGENRLAQYYAATNGSITPNKNFLLIAYLGTTRYFLPMSAGHYLPTSGLYTYGGVANAMEYSIVNSTTIATMRFDSAPAIPYPYALYQFDYIDYIEFDELTLQNPDTLYIDKTGIYLDGINILNHRILFPISSVSNRVNEHDTIIAIPVNNFNYTSYGIRANVVTSVNNLTYEDDNVVNTYPYKIAPTHMLYQLVGSSVVNGYKSVEIDTATTSIYVVDNTDNRYAIFSRQTNFLLQSFYANTLMFTPATMPTSAGTYLVKTITLDRADYKYIGVSVEYDGYTQKTMCLSSASNGSKNVFHIPGPTDDYDYFFTYVNGQNVEFYVNKSYYPFSFNLNGAWASSGVYVSLVAYL